MEHSEKVILKKQPPNNDRLTKALNLIVELAPCISNAKVLPPSVIYEHVLHSMLSKDIPDGRKEFINILRECKVNTSLISNMQMRSEISERPPTFVFNAPKVPTEHTQVRPFYKESSDENDILLDDSTPKATYVKRFKPLSAPPIGETRPRRRKKSPERYSPELVTTKKSYKNKIHWEKLD